MVTGVLVEYRSYDFDERWDVFVQSVIGEFLRGSRVVRGNDEAELQRIARERVRDSLAFAVGWKRDGELPWCEQQRVREHASGALDEQVAHFQREIAKLPEQRSQVLRDVFGEGCNFDQVAANRKIPLRMVKRFLRESIWDLRERGFARERRALRNDDRVKSCLKSLELDLPAFLVEPQLEAWRDFRAHYPACHDCSAVMANWSQVEALVRRACGEPEAHPTERDLLALHREGEGLAYTQYVALMRHLAGCPHCSEAMTRVSRVDGRPDQAALIRTADSTRTGRRRRLRSWFGRLRAQFAP